MMAAQEIQAFRVNGGELRFHNPFAPFHFTPSGGLVSHYTPPCPGLVPSYAGQRVCLVGQVQSQVSAPE